MALTNWWSNETPMPAVARPSPEQFDQPDRPPIDKGFGEASSYLVTDQATDGAAIDRHVTNANAQSDGSAARPSAPPAGRYSDGPDRHII